MHYAFAFVALWILAAVVVWLIALVVGDSTSAAALIGSALPLAVGGIGGLIARRRTLARHDR